VAVSGGGRWMTGAGAATELVRGWSWWCGDGGGPTSEGVGAGGKKAEALRV